jgi:hypothetical protein
MTLSWDQIERDKKQVYTFLKHLQKYHDTLYNELISKDLELPGGKIINLETIISMMDMSRTMNLKDMAKNVVKEYIPSMNTSYEPEILKAIHILLYTTPYTVIEKNIKALILYLIHQEQPHLEQARFEFNGFSGKRKSRRSKGRSRK